MAPRHRELFLRLSLEKRVAEKFVLAGRQNQRARRPRSPERAIASLYFQVIQSASHRD
jgi:hypothetical protein